MADPREITPELLEILLLRELRRASVQVIPRGRRSRPPADSEGGAFAFDLRLELHASGWQRVVVVGLERRHDPLPEEAVAALTERLAEGQAGVLASVSDFEAAAIRRAADEGVMLLEVVDGRAVFREMGFGGAAGYPAWLPEYVARVVEAGPGGLPVRAPMPSDAGDLLARLPERPPAPGEEPAG